MVLVHVQPRALLRALACNPRPDDLRQPVDVHGAHAESRVDLAAHPFRPRLGAEHGDLQADLVRRHAALGEGLSEGQRVARRAGDHIGAEILDERQLPFGHPSRDWDDRHSQAFAAVVEAEAAGEQAVAVGVVEGHPGLGAGRRERARHDARKDVEVMVGVGDDGGLSGRPRRSGDAPQPFPRHRDAPERVRVAQVVLPREGQRAQFTERVDGREGAQPFELQLLQPLAGHRLEVGLEDHGSVWTITSLTGTAWRISSSISLAREWASASSLFGSSARVRKATSPSSVRRKRSSRGG